MQAPKENPKKIRKSRRPTGTIRGFSTGRHDPKRNPFLDEARDCPSSYSHALTLRGIRTRTWCAGWARADRNNA
jgi:hypothetical protein